MHLLLIAVLSADPGMPVSCRPEPAEGGAMLRCCTLASGQQCCSEGTAPDGTVPGCGCR